MSFYIRVHPSRFLRRKILLLLGFFLFCWRFIPERHYRTPINRIAEPRDSVINCPDNSTRKRLVLDPFTEPNFAIFSSLKHTHVIPYPLPFGDLDLFCETFTFERKIRFPSTVDWYIGLIFFMGNHSGDTTHVQKEPSLEVRRTFTLITARDIPMFLVQFSETTCTST